MKVWNFGIVGAGLIADFHAKAIKDIPAAKLKGVCDVNLERARKLAAQYDCQAFNNTEALLSSKEIDIVTIATPSGLHMEPAVAAAQNGKHVICEKPLEITLEKIDAIIEAHKKSGTLLGGVFQNRYNDAVEPLKEAIDSGRFGTITYAGVYVPWWREESYYKDSWHGSWAIDGGGALMNQSIHMIDLLCYLMPSIESVQAFASTIGHKDLEAEDTAVAVLKFSTQALGVIYGTTASFPGQFKRFEITGTKGTVIYTEDSFTVWQFAEEKPEDEQIRKQFAETGTLGGVADPAAISHVNHTKNFQSFIEALETKKGFWLDGAESRKAVEIILAAYKSAKEQRLIKIGEL